MHKLPFPATNAGIDFQKALNDLVRDVYKENIYKTLTPRNVQKFSHGYGWRTHSGDESAKELSKMELHTSEQSLKFKDVVDHNLSVLPLFINELTKNMQDQLMKSLYSKALQSTEKSGNVVSVAKEGSNIQAFIAMLKLIEFGVDEDGKVTFPEVHLPPGSPLLNELQNSNPEFRIEVDQITKQKSDAALLREQERLSKFKK